MTLKKWFYLFWTTLCIGMAAAVLIAVYLMVFDPEFEMQGFLNVAVYFFNMMIIGATYSVFAQMVFFAYLTLNYIALNIFKRMDVWKIIQVILIVVVLFDLVYLRYSLSTEPDQGWMPFAVMPAILLALSWLVAKRKVQLTNKTAFIPTLFFMIVATALEAVPALRMQGTTTFFMMFPLFACNAWQILKLHTLVSKEQKTKVKVEKS